MKRREALKNIGLSLGAITMTSTVIGLIQSCSEGTSWNPNFFSREEADLVIKTLDIMLPTGPNIPGANELNLTQFIDGYIHKVFNKEEQKSLKTKMGVYLSTTLKATGKKKAASLTSKDIEGRLAFYLKANADQKNAWKEEVTSSNNQNGSNPSEDAINFNVLVFLRNRGISAFKITEQIGENVLAYDPVPGKQRGCVDLQETTKGKAWSL